ncbi:bifunctional folylpolyglutamate synthase/dihydrofolate synthase [Thermosulfurimonas marina]|uniref:Dihydrofolate synthase/folylpolyglutamate synthase n=1 Tax=Thermosulfurimonas marina TaxID=2047767 RepID=A0A6H1WRY1_9BACT|nr:folylpolyglutamate synthase/dihydrofolate synthase family protein [Thermosulfurimonas marina]QJA05942.1 bifunctional folylpolyglutamate synthase/dihydrofolate synthase [Thermosulfurimonas marina]
MSPESLLAWLNQHQFHGIKPGLKRIWALLSALGNPERRFPSVHLAGTNGKGSTAAIVAGVLSAHGLRTGLYTSPHLVSVTERFRLNGKEISLERLAQILARIRASVEELGIPVTYFEITTAAAFLFFAEEKVDLAVIECGLGGRLDATNVLRPEVAVITTVARDHMQFLGKTLAAIAREKAGIIKPGVPTVIGRLPPKAREVVLDRTRRLQAPVYLFGRDFRVRQSISGLSFSGRRWRLSRLPLALSGDFQRYNLALALASLEVLEEKGLFELKETPLREALASLKWPGRFEYFPVGPGVILDGAHNEEGVKNLLRSLERRGIREYTLIFGATNEGGDKPYLRMLKKLAPRARRIYLCEPPGPRHPVTLEEWRARLPQALHSRTVFSGPQEALSQALSQREPVVITGSLYLVGALRRLLA